MELRTLTNEGYPAVSSCKSVYVWLKTAQTRPPSAKQVLSAPLASLLAESRVTPLNNLRYMPLAQSEPPLLRVSSINVLVVV